MSEQIKDGTGTGSLAKVDDHGRLWVSANVVDHKQHHALYHQNLYIIHFDTILPDSNETELAFFKNLDSTKDFEIYNVEVSADANIEANWYLNDEYTSGGTLITPINSNRGSGKTLSTSTATVYSGGSAGDMVVDSTDRTKFHRSFVGAYSPHNEEFDGGLVLTAGSSASMTAIGVVGNEVTVTAIMAYHTAGTKL